MPRPTRSAGILVFLAIVLELLSRLIVSTWLTGAAAAVLGAVTADAAMTPRIRGLRLRRLGPDHARVGVGSSVEITVSVPTAIRASRGPVVIDDTTPWGGQTRGAVPALRSGQSASVRLTAIPGQRGHWSGGAVLSVEGRSPLGGFLRRRRLAIDGEMWVQPPAAIPLSLSQARAGHGSDSMALVHAGHGPELLGLREWMSGDSRSMVNWRATARRSQLVVTETARPGLPPLLIACGPVGEGPAWEHSVAVAASTSGAALSAGVTVELINGPDLSPLTTVRNVLDAFAAIEASTGADPTQARPTLRGANAGATVLWLGATPPPAYLETAVRRGGGQILIVPLVEPREGRP